MADIINWLEQDNDRVVLIDIQYYNGTELVELNVSSAPYVMLPSEVYINSLGNSVSDIFYDDIVSIVPSINAKINSSVSVGQIELLNTDGEYDYLLNSTNAIEGHKVSIYLGDPSWSRGEFIKILDGITKDIRAPSISKLAISIRDKKEVLDVEIQEQVIDDDYVSSKLTSATQFFGDVSSDEATIPNTPWDSSIYVIPESLVDQKVPILLGSCFNIEPKLIDSSNHVYLISEGVISSVIEVRSNGVALVVDDDYQVDLAIGCIRLLVHDQSTQITCDVTGTVSRPASADLTYTLVPNSSAALAELLLLTKTNILPADICYDSFVTYPSPVLGLYIPDGGKVIDFLVEILASVGGYIRFAKNLIGSGCTIQILQVTDPNDVLPEDANLLLYEDDIILNKLSLNSQELPLNSLTIGYAKNWTVQDKSSLAGVVLDDNLKLLDSYTTEFSSIKSVNGIRTKYPLSEDGELIETLLTDINDATAELSRRASIRISKRYVYKVETTASPLQINIGDIANIKHSRYGFVVPGGNPYTITDNIEGINCLVIGITEQPTNNKVILEVWL